jgi:hypothetical protein
LNQFNYKKKVVFLTKFKSQDIEKKWYFIIRWAADSEVPQVQAEAPKKSRKGNTMLGYVNKGTYSA